MTNFNSQEGYDRGGTSDEPDPGDTIAYPESELSLVPQPMTTS